jgi:hypothetical protein
MEIKEKIEKMEQGKKVKKGVENVYFSSEVNLKIGKIGWYIEIEFKNEKGAVKGVIQKHHIEELKEMIRAFESINKNE